MAAKTITGKNEKPYPQDVAELNAAVIQLQTTVAALVVLTTEMATELSAHTHGGVTAGAATTAASSTIAAPVATF